MLIPEEFVVQKFYQYANKPKYNRLTRTYQGGCPICKEGKSWGLKRRLFYVTKKNLLFCHNCGWSGNPLKWIMHVTGDSYSAVLSEVQQLDNIKVVIKEEKKIITEDLPDDCIDLYDDTQVEYYKNNNIVTCILKYVKDRRLDTAANRPKTLYTSLKDFTHKNRLIIPFFDKNKPVYYQSRTVLDADKKNKPKYLSKRNGEKSVFNIDNVTDEIDYIFIFEGPIDSFFVRNGVAVAGIQEDSYTTFTQYQSQQIKRYPLHKIIWVLDSQWQDEAGLKKSYKLAENNELIFIWPEIVGKKFKDFNEMCCRLNKDEIKPEFVISNSHSGLKAKLLLSQIKN